MEKRILGTASCQLKRLRLVPGSTGSAGSLSDCALRQSRNNWTPAQSVANVCSTTRPWSGELGTTPCITMSVARPRIEYDDVWATTVSSLLGNLLAPASFEKSCTSLNTACRCRRYIVQRGRCCVPGPRRCYGTAVDGQCRIESIRVSRKTRSSVQHVLRRSRRNSEPSARSSRCSTPQECAICRGNADR